MAGEALKNALLVDLNGSYDTIAGMLPLHPEQYDLTIASSWFDALALVTDREYDLVILEPEHRCGNSTWPLVEQLARSSLADAVIMVHALQPDADFYARAIEYGAVVLASPQGYVAMPSTRDVSAEGAGFF
jgi:hypothetical protein